MTFTMSGNRKHNKPISGIKKMRKMESVVGYPELYVGAPVQITHYNNVGKVGRIVEIRFGHITSAWCDYDIQVALTESGLKVWVRKEHLRGI